MAGNYSLSVRRAGKELKGSIGGVVSRVGVRDGGWCGKLGVVWGLLWAS